jgi:hypothetical protein
MKNAIFYCIAIIVACGCKNAGKPKKVNSKNFQEEKSVSVFFPVTSYLQGQLVDIRKTAVNPLKLTTTNGRTDSIWLKLEDLEIEMAEFLHPVIDSLNMVRYFSEKKFLDQTLNAITLTYDPIGKVPDSIPYRHWDVYIDPETNQVQRIYMIKQLDANTTRQLTWVSGKWCKAISIITRTDGSSYASDEVTFKWQF